jgi:endonuclease YncB( thermonuclease family)
MEEEIPIKAQKFLLDGLSFTARITSVYDGDTIKAIFKFRGVYDTWSCRIIGIDTPELRTKNPEEKELGYKARDFLRELVLNKIVQLKCHKFDKYGRLLVDITFGDEGDDVKGILIRNNFALPYDGGKKKEFNIENYR